MDTKMYGPELCDRWEMWYPGDDPLLNNFFTVLSGATSGRCGRFFNPETDPHLYKILFSGFLCDPHLCRP